MIPPLVLISTLRESFSRATSSSVPDREAANEPFLAYMSRTRCTAWTARLWDAGSSLVVDVISSHFTVFLPTVTVPSTLPSLRERMTPSLLMTVLPSGRFSSTLSRRVISSLLRVSTAPSAAVFCCSAFWTAAIESICRCCSASSASLGFVSQVNAMNTSPISNNPVKVFLSIFSCQFSVVSFQLSVFSFLLLVVSFLFQFCC